MERKYGISIISGLLAFLVSYICLSSNDKNKNKGFELSFEKAGKPDQMDHKDHAQLENAKMVSEGSQFGVQYYNKSTKDR